MLAIPPQTLAYGLYAFVFSVTMDPTMTAQIFTSTVSTFVLIDASPLIGAMIPGAMLEVQVGYAQMLCVDPATYSVDPDETGTQVHTSTCTNKAHTVQYFEYILVLYEYIIGVEDTCCARVCVLKQLVLVYSYKYCTMYSTLCSSYANEARQ